MDIVSTPKKVTRKLEDWKHWFLYQAQSNMHLRLFLSFLLGLWLTYAAVDFVLDSRATEALVGAVMGATSGGHIPIFSYFLEDLRNAHLLVALFIFMLFAAVAALFTELASLPVARAQSDQRRFVANVSHELRTPLSIMKTTAEVIRLRGQKVTPDELNEFTQEIVNEVNRMSSIIEFFLRFATMESKRHFQMAPVNISQVVNKIVSILSSAADGKGITLGTNIRPVANIWGNFTALEEMILNLMKNAINYTQKDGSITATVIEEYNEVVVMIADTGNGISHEDLPHIFEPFYKGMSGTRKKEGIGLGLTIVREIVKMHRAKIFVESVIGKGTTFTVRFPKHKS